VLLPLAVIQSGVDLFMWGRPFAEISEYVRYNFANATTYGTLPWYNYLLLLAAVFIPPLSLGVFFGYFISWRRHLLIWMPVFLFLAAHSWFPNKQERFIFPILPLFFVIGWCGWEQLACRVVLVAAKRSLVVAQLQVRLGAQRRSVGAPALQLQQTEPLRGLPRVAADAVGHGRRHRGTRTSTSPRRHRCSIGGSGAHRWSMFPIRRWTCVPELAHWTPERRPNVVMFIGLEDLEGRKHRVEQAVGALQEVGTARPGLLDRFVHWLNPVNRNETIITFRILDHGA
jgi:hypothetical protein